jgi:hypothetical protein
MTEPYCTPIYSHAINYARDHRAGSVTLFFCERKSESDPGHYRQIDTLPDNGLVIKVDERGRVTVLILPHERPEA